LMAWSAASTVVILLRSVGMNQLLLVHGTFPRATLHRIRDP
jgi:hypothetical protein